MQITVGYLIERLSLYNKDSILYFSGLEFSREKPRGPDKDGNEIIQIEFVQETYRDEQGVLVVRDLD